MGRIKESQLEDEKLCIIRDKVLSGEVKEVILDQDSVLRIKGRICVLKVGDLIRLIFEEAHCLRYFIHLGVGKMHHNLK